MKSLKLLLLGIFATTFMACPSDDDTPPPTPNTIVGTWKFFKSFENGVEDTLDLCDTEETLIFGLDGEFSGLYYDDLNGTCLLEDTITGTWTRVGSIYSITTEGETESEEFIFEDSNTFSVEYTETDAPGGPSITYKEIYKRQ